MANSEREKGRELCGSLLPFAPSLPLLGAVAELCLAASIVEAPPHRSAPHCSRSPDIKSLLRRAAAPTALAAVVALVVALFAVVWTLVPRRGFIVARRRVGFFSEISMSSTDT